MKNVKRSYDFKQLNLESEGENSGQSGSSSKAEKTKEDVIDSGLSEVFDTCFVDHSLKQFACIHDKCSDRNGCFKNELLNEKLIFSVLQFHQDDRSIWCKEVFPDILNFTAPFSKTELRDYIFSFNHRYVRRDGSVSQFLHEGSLIFNKENCLPVLNLKVFYELGDMKTDDNMVLSIFRYIEDKGYQKVFTKVYLAVSNSLLSVREIEIIRLCHEGLSSKMIADKLNISIHTVKNHKRKIMKKTETHNITELIHFCLKSHWL